MYCGKLCGMAFFGVAAIGVFGETETRTSWDSDPIASRKTPTITVSCGQSEKNTTAYVNFSTTNVAMAACLGWPQNGTNPPNFEGIYPIVVNVPGLSTNPPHNGSGGGYYSRYMEKEIYCGHLEEQEYSIILGLKYITVEWHATGVTYEARTQSSSATFKPCSHVE